MSFEMQDALGDKLLWYMIPAMARKFGYFPRRALEYFPGGFYQCAKETVGRGPAGRMIRDIGHGGGNRGYLFSPEGNVAAKGLRQYRKVTVIKQGAVENIPSAAAEAGRTGYFLPPKKKLLPLSANRTDAQGPEDRDYNIRLPLSVRVSTRCDEAIIYITGVVVNRPPRPKSS